MSKAKAPFSRYSPATIRKFSTSVIIFFVILLIPLSILFTYTFQQLEVESYANLRERTLNLSYDIDAAFQNFVEDEELRTFDDFRFDRTWERGLGIRSLGRHDIDESLIGYFQIDSDGVLTSPLLPRQPSKEDRKIADFSRRDEIRNQLKDILEQNSISTTPSDSTLALEQNIAQQKVKIGKQASKSKSGKSFELDESYLKKSKGVISKPKPKKKSLSKKKLEDQLTKQIPDQTRVLVNPFSGEIDPYRFGLLESGHFALYRKVWKSRQRYIQGALFTKDEFFSRYVGSIYKQSSVSDHVSLIVNYSDDNLINYLGPSPRTLVSRMRLSSPFDDIELVFAADSLPKSTSFAYIIAVSLALLVVLLGGTLAIYFAGRKQFELAHQQSNFVSAVSHELKTPLTSIRMYGEMLREGWADESKKKTYYKFILDESERLSRLIENILMFSRAEKGIACTKVPVSVADFSSKLNAIVSTMVQSAGFELDYQIDKDVGDQKISTDLDAVTQIVINLVDNGIKFSRKSSMQRIVFSFVLKNGFLIVSVRDFGPGIPLDEQDQIFKLFYRSEDELTRSTSGTGIGLALVQTLANQLDITVDMSSNAEGTRFDLFFRIL